MINAMTIDVEDYFQVSAFDRVVTRAEWGSLESRVERNTDRLLGIFDEAGVSATFFVLGWVADRVPGLVGRIAAAGHEVASHGYGHRLIYEQTPGEFREDVRRAKGVLEDACGREVRGYRAPSFSIVESTRWALDVLADEGYRYDASIFPIHHDRYGIADAPRHPHHVAGGRIVEVPASTFRVSGVNLPVAGGGYFRLLPYAWTAWGIRQLNTEEERPAVFYLHPWEIDPDQPRLPVGGLSRIRHYTNLGRTEARLRRLLRDFSFGPLGDWTTRLARFEPRLATAAAAQGTLS